MNIVLIQPSQLDDNQKPIRYRKMLVPFLSLPTVAGLTPREYSITIVNDYVEDIDYTQPADLVGITGLTCQAPRAYQIAREFKKRGVQTIMGGIHASAVPDDVLNHFDSVLIGEAEGVWKTVLDDVKNNRRLKRIYRTKNKPDLQTLNIPRFDLINKKHYFKKPFSRLYDGIPIQTTRGCPFKCDFCSVMNYLGNTIRKKPIKHVIKEIQAHPASYYLFTDDNIIGDPEYAEALFKALIPLKIKWYSQASTNFINHPHLISLASQSGCLGLLMGIETIDTKALKAINKYHNHPSKYAELLRTLKEHDILVDPSIICGLDNDTPENFDHTINELMAMDSHFLILFYLTPLPMSPFYERIKSENRILTDDWSKYDGLHPIIKYNNFSETQIADIYWNTYKKFYTVRNAFSLLWKFRRHYFKRNAGNNFFLDFCGYLLFKSHAKKRKNTHTIGW